MIGCDKLMQVSKVHQLVNCLVEEEVMLLDKYAVVEGSACVEAVLTTSKIVQVFHVMVSIGVTLGFLVNLFSVILVFFFSIFLVLIVYYILSNVKSTKTSFFSKIFKFYEGFIYIKIFHTPFSFLFLFINST